MAAAVGGAVGPRQSRGREVSRRLSESVESADLSVKSAVRSQHFSNSFHLLVAVVVVDTFDYSNVCVVLCVILGLIFLCHDNGKE